MTAIVVDWLREDFGLEVVALEPVAHGVDPAAQRWRALDGSGAAFAVKLSTAGTGNGFALTAHLARAGVVGVPAPIPTRAGDPVSHRERGRLSVVPWIDGAPAIETGLTQAQWADFGRLVATVHASDPGAAPMGLRREEHDPTVAIASVRALGAALGSARAVDVWHAAAPTIERLIDRAQRLAVGLRATRPSTVACHGDPHLGNLLVDSGGRIWLVDWDDAVLAPPERDLMFGIGGVYPLVTPEQTGWFLAGYGPVEPDPQRLAYYRCVRALEDLIWPQLRGSEPDDRVLEIVAGAMGERGLAALALA